MIFVWKWLYLNFMLFSMSILPFHRFAIGYYFYLFNYVHAEEVLTPLWGQARRDICLLVTHIHNLSSKVKLEGCCAVLIPKFMIVDFKSFQVSQCLHLSIQNLTSKILNLTFFCSVNQLVATSSTTLSL